MFQYVELNVAGGRQRAIAYCHAWNIQGRGLSLEQHGEQHLPDQRIVDEQSRALFPDAPDATA